jgi:twitching motility protein PilT
MSAIDSLLRVMTLRDAEAIVLETGKVPALRRRGNVEAMSMPPLDARMLEEFVAPLLAGRGLDEGPVMVSFTGDDGALYPVTVEKAASGLRIVVRKAAPAKKAPPAKPAAATAPPPSTPAAPAATPTIVELAPAVEIAVDDRKPRIGRLLAPAVATAAEREASDVIVSTGQPVRLRIDGRLETLELHTDDGELAACVAGSDGAIASPGSAGARSTPVGSAQAFDLSLELDGVRVRVNAFEHLGGHAIAARLIREHVPGLADLGLPAELAAIVEQREGLVLVCGPTGSGKSTTLAALIDTLDQRRAAHVITIEDPIEYRFHPRRCLVHQRELGTHEQTFAAGVRAALREAPDVILLGELRDRDTIAAALTAAETGHLVLATLHAPSATGAIDRVIDAFPEQQQRQVRQQLAACLRVVITQYLLPRRDGGRAVAIEHVPVTSAVANIIRKGELQTLPTAIQSGREAGMIPLERSLAKLLDAGTVAPQAVKRIAADHDLLTALAGKLR